jgi:hypothetical protein
MSTGKHDKQSAFARLDARLEKLHKQRPILFNLIALGLGLATFGILELIESVLRWALR